MGSRFQPVAIEERLTGIGGGNHHIRAVDRRFCSVRWLDWDSKLLGHFGAKRLPSRRIPPKRLGGWDRPPRAYCFARGARFPPRAKNPHAEGGAPRNIFGPHP